MDYETFANEWHLLQSNAKNNFSHKYLEKPAMANMLNSNLYSSILLLGCGSGEEIEYLNLKKYAIIDGVDSSRSLINIAKHNYPNYNFFVEDINLWNTNKKYDLIYSSLTFHYIKNWNSLFKKLHNALTPNGELLFSIHHPIKWGSDSEKNKNENIFKLGYQKSKNSSTFEVWGDYLNSRSIDYLLFKKINITYYHKPISEMINIFIKNQFQIVEMCEPKPLEITKKEKPDFYQVYSKIPLFLIFKLKKI